MDIKRCKHWRMLTLIQRVLYHLCWLYYSNCQLLFDHNTNRDEYYQTYNSNIQQYIFVITKDVDLYDGIRSMGKTRFMFNFVRHFQFLVKMLGQCIQSYLVLDDCNQFYKNHNFGSGVE
eukprot:TRINITY_DN7249_c0_g1_i3.p3 TRINITY_DN7249_c0_g1~~TRINITY_DN7249_c0_g1_i3.p3  ORF type:complete len:119 (-),score=0.26 TRINITY_DN7249_c0_g1_i3:5-361(-)